MCTGLHGKLVSKCSVQEENSLVCTCHKIQQYRHIVYRTAKHRNRNMYIWNKKLQTTVTMKDKKNNRICRSININNNNCQQLYTVKEASSLPAVVTRVCIPACPVLVSNHLCQLCQTRNVNIVLFPFSCLGKSSTLLIFEHISNLRLFSRAYRKGPMFHLQ